MQTCKNCSNHATICRIKVLTPGLNRTITWSIMRVRLILWSHLRPKFILDVANAMFVLSVMFDINVIFTFTKIRSVWCLCSMRLFVQGVNAVLFMFFRSWLLLCWRLCCAARDCFRKLFDCSGSCSWTTRCFCWHSGTSTTLLTPTWFWDLVC